MNKLVTQVLDGLIAEIEAGTVPWRKTWRAGLPYNQTTLKSYHGINVLMLWVELAQKGYKTNGWATRKQWAEVGAKVKDGEKDTPILIYKVVNEDDEERRYTFTRCAWVFNADQVEGYEVPSFDVTSNPDIDEWMASLHIPIIKASGPCYYQNQDAVGMPPMSDFESAESYYCSAFHELAHATGHKSRLDRPMVGSNQIHHDKEAKQLYASEELVAEMCAAFTAAHFGIDPDQHASYLSSWLKAFDKDKRGTALYFAAKHAGKAFDWLIENGEAKAEPHFQHAAE